MIGFIAGSGMESLGVSNKKAIETPWGKIEVGFLKNGSAVLSRHGERHERLPHQINYCGNLWALREVGCDAVVSLTVVGALNPDLELGKAYIVNELFYPDNRLPNGEACTIFTKVGDKGRGHLIAGSLFNDQVAKVLGKVLGGADQASYFYSIGPRFNTKMEVKTFREAGGDLISQTCGPESVLANELELPYGMVAFAIDYANGVKEVPTSIDDLNANLAKSADIFDKLLRDLPGKLGDVKFENFVYRFE